MARVGVTIYTAGYRESIHSCLNTGWPTAASLIYYVLPLHLQ